MAIWTNLIKRAIAPIINESVKELKEGDVEKALATQALTFGTDIVKEGGVVDKVLPRGVRFQTLRDFSVYYPPLRSCINYRKRQINQLEWTIAPKEVITNKKKKEQYEKDARVVKNFFRYPAGDKTLSFRTFVNKIIEDLLVLDAVAVYRRRNRRGDLIGYLPIDGSTIELVLNEDGTIPQPPNEAYIQKIGGREKARLTTDELIYKIMNPRTNSPYGLSPVEALILVVTTALKLAAYNIAYFQEGNVPEGFVELPKDIASSPDQLKLWQEAWDAMFSGNARFQRKIKFLPEGMKWHPLRKASDIQFERFDKWLLLQVCSTLEVAPQAIGFQFDRGKGATEAEWEIGKERGLFPLALFLKEMFDEMIQEDLGQEHLHFVWTNINPTNMEEEANVFAQLVRTGAVSVDEWRIGEGLEPIGLGHYIMTPVGPIMVKDLVGSSEAGLKPFIPDSGTGTPVPKPADIQQKIGDFTKADVVEELKRWKRAASNDLKQGKSFRDFKTEIIDSRTQKLIEEGLKNVKSKKDLDDLFNPFISQQTDVVSAMLDLYDEVSTIVGYESKKTKKNSKSN